jgi:serine protease SohB
LRPRLFVFDFKPGEGAEAAMPQSTKSRIELLTASVDFILATASKHDEALLRLTSPGGAVSTYGLAAAQLQRLRDEGVRLTICVDTIAASGGYMMACVGDRIVATPFSMVGSIGVIAGVPNLHKVLERNDVEFVQETAGKYKRTVNMLTPNTDEGRAKFREDINIVHEAFKSHIKENRPSLDVEAIATGEVWLGSQALDKGLVDELGTSDEVIRKRVLSGFDAIQLSKAKEGKKGLAKLLEGASPGAEAFLSGLARAAISAGHRAMSALGRTPAPRVEAQQQWQ